MAEQDFEIRIKTSADLKALQDLKAGLADQIKSTKSLGQDSSALESSLKKLNAALASEHANTVRVSEAKKHASEASKLLGRHTEEFSKALEEVGHHIPGFEKLSGLMTKMGEGAATSGLGGAIAALAGALASVAAVGVHEFMLSEEAVTRLDAALAQTGNLTEQYRDRMQALASQLQATTSIADEEWLSVLKTLTQFGSTPESIGMDVEAVKNLAGVMGGDLHGAAMLVSRALEGNFDLFRRHGIIIEDTGTKTEKLTKLYSELALKGGGQLEASSKTLTGQFHLLKNVIGDVLENIGGFFSIGLRLRELLAGLGVLISDLAKKFSVSVPALDGLKNAAKRTTQSFEGATSAASGLKSAQDKIKQGADDAAAALEREINKLNQLKETEDKISDSKMALELAQVEKRKKLGQIGDVQALSQEAAIRERYAQKKFKSSQALDASVIATAKGEIGEIDQNYLRGEKDISAKQKSLSALEAFEKARAERDRLKDEISGRKQEIEQLRPFLIPGHPTTESAVFKHQETQLHKSEVQFDKVQSELPGLFASAPKGITSEQLKKQIEDEKQRHEATREEDLKRRQNAQKTAEDAERRRKLQGELYRIDHETDRTKFEGDYADAQRKQAEENKRKAEDDARQMHQGAKVGKLEVFPVQNPAQPIGSASTPAITTHPGPQAAIPAMSEADAMQAEKIAQAVTSAIERVFGIPLTGGPNQIFTPPGQNVQPGILAPPAQPVGSASTAAIAHPGPRAAIAAIPQANAMQAEKIAQEAISAVERVFGITLDGFGKLNEVTERHESQLKDVVRSISNINGRIGNLRNP